MFPPLSLHAPSQDRPGQGIRVTPGPHLPTGVPGWGCTPPSAQGPQAHDGLRPVRVGGAQGLAGPVATTLARISRAPSRQARSHPPPGVMAGSRAGGAAWSGSTSSAGPSAPHFHRPLPQSAPPWSSLPPGQLRGVSLAPLRTPTEGLSFPRASAAARASSLGHDGCIRPLGPALLQGSGWRYPEPGPSSPVMTAPWLALPEKRGKPAHPGSEAPPGLQGTSHPAHPGSDQRGLWLARG